MNDWKKVTLNDIGKIVTGKTPKTKNTEFWNGGIPFVTPADLQKSKHIFSTARTVSHIGLNSVKGATLPAGAVCVSCIGNLGYTALTTQKSVSNQQINSIIPNSDFDNDFVYYLMKSLWDEFKNLEGQSTTLSILNKTLFSKIEVLVPDKVTQQPIAQVLSSLDDKIELNAQINHNLEEQAKAIFKSWFVDFEPFQDGEFIDTELGQIPAGWRIGTLNEIADITMGQSPQGSSYNEDSVGTVFYQGRAEFSDRFPVRRLFTTEPKRMAEAGDVLLSVRAPVGDMNIANESCCIGRGLAAIHAKKAFSSFVFYTMHALKPELDKYNGEGTVFGCINKDALNSQKIIIPPDNIIFEFEQTASSLDRKYLAGFQENMRLTQLRDALLPKLMSGEIDVSEVEV